MTPENFSTLIEMLAYRAEVTGAKVAFTFKEQPCTFAELWQGVNHFAAFLLAGGLQPKECVVVAVPNSAEFFSGFYGIQRAGGIAVPVFPGGGEGRVFSLAALCGARKILVPANLPDKVMALYLHTAAECGIGIITLAESAAVALPARFPEVLPSDIAFLQYTSGSTGSPKGVMLTHISLLTNVRQMIAGVEITAQDIFVSWLPVYHDMGLILKTMTPFYLAAELHLLPTDLRGVRTWLEAIQRHRATFTAAPDFAYRLVLQYVAAGAYDLSSLRVAINAAEPVRSTTLQGFGQLFGLKDVMVAAYGLAEATVGVSAWKPHTPARVDGHGRVSVGRPFPGVEILILNEGESLPAGEIGEIAIRSQANSLGYFKNPAETARLFWKDGYFLSGDLGYLDEDGYLYIAGRKKNIIKRAGETVSPQEIEETLDAMPSVRMTAALGVDQGGIEGEQLFVFVEIQRSQSLAAKELHELSLQLVERINAHMGFRPSRLYLLKPHSIPRTYNGKIQHALLRESYLDGSLRSQGAILYPDI